MKDNESPIIYLWIYKKMVDKFGKENQIILAKHLLEVLRRTVWQIPRKYDYYILRELCDLGFMERVNTQRYKLLAAQAEKKLGSMADYSFW